LRRRHVAEERFPAGSELKAAATRERDAAHEGDTASAAWETPLKITRPRRTSRGRPATS
jgi:hypothetical protein